VEVGDLSDGLCIVSASVLFVFVKPTGVEWLGHKTHVLTCYASRLKMPRQNFLYDFWNVPKRNV